MLSHSVLFATYAETDDELSDVLLLAKSLRTFGGRFADTPIIACHPEHADLKPYDGLDALGISLKSVLVPDDVSSFFYAGKPYAAARAEAEADGKYELLVWLDGDTIILNEPIDFDLRYMKNLAYRPVMHNRAGSRYDEPPSPYWQRIYDRSGVADDRLFVMHSQADEERIRPFFQAGCLVTRPHLGIFRRWAEQFIELAADSELASMCRDDRTLNVFLHQAALVGPVVKRLNRDELLELSEGYSYPLLFERAYDSKRSFASLAGVVTMRRVVSPAELGDNWLSSLDGPIDKLAWLREQLG